MSPPREENGTVRWDLLGLEPETTYAVNLQTARLFFKTPAEPDKPAKVTIAFGSCADDRPGIANPVWPAIQKDAPEVLVLLGDTPYIDSTDLAAQRRRYVDLFAAKGLASLLRDTVVYATWDDHDYAMDDADGKVAGKENSRKAFLEHHGNPTAGEENQGIYTRFRRGPRRRVPAGHALVHGHGAVVRGRLEADAAREEAVGLAPARAPVVDGAVQGARVGDRVERRGRPEEEGHVGGLRPRAQGGLQADRGEEDRGRRARRRRPAPEPRARPPDGGDGDPLPGARDRRVAARRERGEGRGGEDVRGGLRQGGEPRVRAADGGLLREAPAPHGDREERRVGRALQDRARLAGPRIERRGRARRAGSRDGRRADEHGARAGEVREARTSCSSATRSRKAGRSRGERCGRSGTGSGKPSPSASPATGRSTSCGGSTRASSTGSTRSWSW